MADGLSGLPDAEVVDLARRLAQELDDFLQARRLTTPASVDRMAADLAADPHLLVGPGGQPTPEGERRSALLAEQQGALRADYERDFRGRVERAYAEFVRRGVGAGLLPDSRRALSEPWAEGGVRRVSQILMGLADALEKARG